MPSDSKVVLVVQHDRFERASLRRACLDDGRRVIAISSPTDGSHLISSTARIDAALLEVHPGPESGLMLALQIRVAFPEAAIALLTSYPLSPVLVERLRCGINRVFLLPTDFTEVRNWVGQELH